MAIAEVDAIGVENTNKPADELVLVDAYWIKEYQGEKIKIRVLPHQMPVDLYMEFVYKFDDDKHDKDAAPAIDVNFKVKGTIFDEKSTITIDSSKITKFDPMKRYNGPKTQYVNKVVYYRIYNSFISDLYPLRHRVGLVDEIVLKDVWLLNKGNISFNSVLSRRNSTREIVLHCSATQGYETVEDIHQMHLKNITNDGKHWAGIGYHYFIDIDGNIWEGRPEEYSGAHVEGHNNRAIGICYSGGIVKVNSKMQKSFDTRNEKQIESMKKLCRYLHIKYPAATFHGHYEFANKDCPCFNVNNWINTFSLDYSASEQVSFISNLPCTVKELFIVVGFRYNKINYDKNNAERVLKYTIEDKGDGCSEMKEIVIKGIDLLNGNLKSYKFKDIEGNECFLIELKDLISVEHAPFIA